MNNKLFQKVISLVLLVGLISALSSCNRGVGCPTNFSMKNAVGATIVK